MAIAIDIRPLTLSEIPAAMRLSTQAGWNQIDADWRRLIRLWPELCLGGWRDGQLVATATLATFGGWIGWVGMVLVDETCRGQGLGGTIMDAILAAGDRVGIGLLGLDATDLGQPVYLKRGFVGQIGVDRWQATTRPRSARVLPDAQPHDWTGILQMDRQATGVDRSDLLKELASETGARVHVMNDERGWLEGFGFSRQGRVAGYLGPIVAVDAPTAAALIGSLLASFPSGQPIYIDVPRDRGLEPHLAQHGFTVARKLLRMTRPRVTAPALLGPSVWSIAGLELG